TPDMAERTLAEIMAAAREVAKDAGAEIVGGHTTQGAELTIGFTVTGLCTAAPIMLAGAEAGDDLVLTKPIGSGTLMAAAMRGVARGWDVAAAWDVMAQPQGEAARVLKGANAMTDVTGFGLVGHLRGLAEAGEGVDAELWPKAVPLMPGAMALAQAGIRSSIFPENAAGDPSAQSDPLRALLYDPQTGGGLLTAVNNGAAAVKKLKDAGYEAAVVGRFVPGTGAVHIR
ncbi:MAG: selenide, water dikinase SelD, partial [Pseudomonadota bacterium]